jgi:hypothetical protein
MNSPPHSHPTTWVNLNSKSFFLILKNLKEHHFPKMQSMKRESEKYHHRDTDFIPIVLLEA